MKSEPMSKSSSSKQSHLLRRPRPPPVSSSQSEPTPNKPYMNRFDAEEQTTYYPDGSETYHEGMSPPPPSEHYGDTEASTQKSFPSTRSTRRTTASTCKSTNKRYILDPLHRDKTNLGTYVEGSLVRPYKPRGPDPLPVREPRRNPQWFPNVLRDEEDLRYYQPPAFTMQDFLIKISEKEKVPIESVQQIMLSQHNYKKIQNLLTQKLHPEPSQMKTINMELPEEAVHASPRIPYQQILIEMASLVKEQMSGFMMGDLKSVIRPLPQYSPDYHRDSVRPQKEIVLYEDTSKERENTLSEMKQNSEIPGNDNIFMGATARYFQGSRRSNSPFATAESFISPTELAVLDSLMNGGTALSLKAHFISQLPDMEPLTHSVTYLNLSFNNFRFVPVEIFDISQLKVLKLRNNPIKEIPADIGRLENLKVLVFSFCLVSTLPLSLFSLSQLEHLDCAYNKITFLPNEVRKFRYLRELNLEGNQLPAMPAGSLRLQNLRYLRVRNNLMHPLFWKEYSTNQPQSLCDLATLVIKQNNLDQLYPDLPDHVIITLECHSKCDCCGGPLYGPGLKTIRPVSKIFGIKNLPFMFRCCSAYCYNMFCENTDSLMDMLYGCSSWKEIMETKS